MTALTSVALVVGLVALVWGADLLVRGAASIAARLGIPPVVIGLTVVAFGTSAPELAVSASASLDGQTDVALGNLVGSNIANVLLILGASAAIGGLAVSMRIIRLDVPIVVGVSVVVTLMALDGSIGRIDGALLFAGIVTYTVWLVRATRAPRDGAAALVAEEEIDEEVEEAIVERPLPVLVGLVVVGLAALVAGGQLLVGSATDIAGHFGVSELVIGLTVVAVGTSLPELATSVMAAIRGQRDIAVGNVVGSNLFNLMGVLGITAVLADGGIPVSDAALRLDLPVMLASAIALLPIMWNGFEIRRWEGVVLLAFYVGYVTFLVLDASDHAAAAVVGPALAIVTPLVLLTFAVTGYRGWRRYQEQRQAVRVSREPPLSGRRRAPWG